MVAIDMRTVWERQIGGLESRGSPAYVFVLTGDSEVACCPTDGGIPGRALPRWGNEAKKKDPIT